jgi:hypothetical protein
MAMASTATAAASPRLAFPLLSAPASSSSSSNTLRFPLRRRRASRPLAVAAFKKLSEASLVPIPEEPTQPLVDEDSLPPKPGVYGVYDPAGELQFVGISRNVRASVEGHRRKVPANLCASVKVRHRLSMYIIVLQFIYAPNYMPRFGTKPVVIFELALVWGSLIWATDTC